MSDDAVRKAAKKPAMSIEKAQKARRKFLQSVGLTAGVVGISLFGYIPVKANAASADPASARIAR